MRSLCLLALVCMLLTMSVPAAAQDDKELGWFLSADLAAVWVGGNSQSSTYGLGLTGRRVFTRSELKLEAGGNQTESTLKTRTAIGSTDNFRVDEEENTEKTAELFYARGRYDWNVTERFQVLGGVDWMRNTFSGIDSRTLIGLGAGNTWANNEDVKFSTDYSFTYTFEQAVVENPFVNSDFPGVRFGYTLWWKLTETTEFNSSVALDWNLDNTDDIRADWVNSLPVSLTDRLKLKPTLQLLWRNDPALKEVDLFDTAGNATGNTVLVPLDELDTIFTLALVVNI